jgi:WD40 repeat protein
LACAASDLYSLGVTCIHLLTGLSPFALVDGIENRWIWRDLCPPAVATGISESRREVLFKLLDRLIAWDLDRRFSSAAAIAAFQAYQPLHVPQLTRVHSWQPMLTLSGHHGLFANVNAVAISAQNQLASASDDRTIRLWDLPSGRATGLLTGHGHFVQAIAFHPQNGDILISGSRDCCLKRWHRGQLDATWTGHTQGILAVAFTPSGGQIISGSADKTLKQWDSQTGVLKRTMMGHRLAVTALAPIPGQSALIASASADATVKLWNLDTGELVQTLTGHTAAIRALAVSPDGAWLASGGEDRTIRLWHLATGQVRCLSGHSWSVAALRFTPDGETLISASWDHSLKIWSLSPGQMLEQLTGHLDVVSSLALSADGHLMVSGGHDATLRVWQRHG